MNDGMVIGLLVALCGLGTVMVALTAMCVRLARRVRDLTISMECLCTNLGGLRAQIGHGHPHEGAEG